MATVASVDLQCKQAAAVTVLRGTELIVSPWKNGGGVTREIAVHPPGATLDAFEWRVSVADVGAAGPFSRFAGVDRTLVLLAGAGMLLDVVAGDGQRRPHVLSRVLDLARFAGEDAVDARLVDGPTRDFNLMVRRDRATGYVDLWRGDVVQSLSAQVVLLYCACGRARVTLAGTAPVTLDAGDALRIDAPQRLDCRVTDAGIAADTAACALLVVSIDLATTR
ncbi:hypothetical protein DFQ28_007940 [Apophysomyces sp. BC1034]|nr:hypothetical protein DFQ28_007940 [Apophysomyces sp. BC1034]